MERLPPELLHNIVGYLEDTPSLSDCSLVSRKLHSVVRSQLFSAIDPPDSEGDFELVTHFLARNIDIVHHIHKLSLGPNAGEDSSITTGRILEVATSLPRLRHLHLLGLIILPPPVEPRITKFNGERHHLETLLIADCAVGMIPLLALLSLFRVDHAEVHWTPTMMVNPDDSIDADQLVPQGPIEEAIPPFDIASFFLKCADYQPSRPKPPIGEALRQLLPRSGMHTFRFEDELMLECYLETLPVMLRDIGHTIINFDVAPLSPQSYNVLAQTLPLLPNLRSFKCDTEGSLYAYPNGMDVSAIEDLAGEVLSALPTRLTRLELCITYFPDVDLNDVHEDPVLDQTPWGVVSNVLQHFPELKLIFEVVDTSVSDDFRPPAPVEDAHLVLAQLFPAFHARRALEVHTSRFRDLDFGPTREL
ncbi:uncharacterized protein BXZ73DRAFT_103614 [Epithele typhae]|uniref:uncharacterized protein n=1 Tax=Epithele typhae TaxID=378194 RepID=UPI002008ACA8|nr:uncharacterized protein BXZ73DRAFT_103614 [Epithele typhae]KAH9924323.1 hypothetical protein BXZ73DRAFT_103614 [Epithele typhae]